MLQRGFWLFHPILLSFFLGSAALAQTAGGAPSAAGPSIEQNLVARLKAQPISQGTAENLGLPDEFLQRVADRIIRMDYQKRFRVVLKDDAAAQAGPSASPRIDPEDEPASKRSFNLWSTLIGCLGLGLLVVLIRHLRARTAKGGRK